ncbi:hypothetical protein GTQ48_07980 [Alteromonas genovensis]|uniref:Uncharacterized protein n=1 Tax=Alteromonas genovensis TaxID=471225 RepID=A0A6N9THR3_9ALTE|nr:hypothetical protein [Alteromonas genovensis]NDW15456.1 hypothetical protein [Alteromonas genovensis]
MEKEYKYTKKLLRLAIEENKYRNKDIAIKAGLSEKSVALVSKWRNGKANATERQMAYFINNYEYLLKPKIEHLFYTYENALDSSVQACPTYRKLIGEVIFKHQLSIPIDKKSRLSICRVIIIAHNGQYFFVEQIRAGLKSPANAHFHSKLDGMVRSNNEEANWVLAADIEADLSLDGLIQAVNRYCEKLQNGEPYLVIRSINSFPFQDIKALEYSFYQCMLKLNLHSELFPF